MLDYIIGAIPASLSLVLFVLIFRRLIKTGEVDFYSGFLVGVCVFVGGPIVLALIFGSVPASDLPIPSVTIKHDAGLFLYIFAIVLVIYISGLASRRSILKIKSLSSKDNNKDLIKFFKFSFFSYLALTLAMFWMVGKWTGGHWHETGGALLGNSALAVIVGNFSNVFRVIVPGVLAYLRVRGAVKNGFFLSILALYCAVELILVNNRIVVLFALLSCLLVYRRKLRALSIIAIIAAPPVLFFNHAYPIARGLMWTDGFSIDAIVESFEIAFDARINADDGSNSTSEMLGSAFEATNLNVLKYVYDGFGDTKDFYYGETVVLKSLTFFLPKSVWENKPSGFGSDLGLSIMGNPSLTLNSTSLGEFYGNFGFYSIVVLPLAMLFIAWLRVVVLPSSIKYDYALFFCGFAALRFEYSFVVISLFCVFVLSICDRARFSLR